MTRKRTCQKWLKRGPLSYGVVALTSLLLGACDGSSLTSSSAAVSSFSSSSVGSTASSEVSSNISSETLSSVSSSSEPSIPSEPLCEAPADLEITDIASVVDWVNAMPKPLTLACFVKSLPRPMYYNATLSSFSAQPSVGKRSPRVFFMINDLVLTVVPDEKSDTKRDPETGKVMKDPETGLDLRFWDLDNIQLLELSMEVETALPTRQSIKAELKFPVTEQLPRNAPYVKINYDESNTLSVCAFCHSAETQVEVLDGQPVYRSEMLRNPRDAEVPLGYMLNEYASCDPQSSENEWYRCEMLDAIYGQGTLVWKSFPEDMPTIFDN